MVLERLGDRRVEFLDTSWGHSDNDPSINVYVLARRPDFLVRLQHLQQAGLQPGSTEVQPAVTYGRLDVLQYLRDSFKAQVERGGDRAGLDEVAYGVMGGGGVQVLEYLQDCGLQFTAAHVGLLMGQVDMYKENVIEDEPEVAYMLHESAAVWLIEAASISGGDVEVLSGAFQDAARSGAGRAVLDALRKRGAVVDVDAVWAGGCRDALDWAMAGRQ
ncbi:hypothetical protein HXX76_012407 [Chlamydomonas incerta]|uniref:Uncharacterized protein n=1 Tax=Chlamydomonas incerta TaxID=51695 RepID=A0A835SKZ2_CHLIN|nr:hypothetical protein HXX76_012407 [Chlamydomonas incerta]|eukprot:KAG2427471.1 hypothetical protein HXX76_012407 [Chlamydomonas incerta]